MNAVIAAATGLNKNDLAVFIGSMQKHVLAELFLIVATDESWMAEYKFISRVIIEPTLHISMERNFAALEILKANPGKYDRILLSDARDVVFQADPFTSVNGLMTGQEESTIGKSKANSYWLKDLYGEQIVEDLSDKPVACSGLAMGPVGEIEGYLKAMCEMIDECPDSMRHGPNLDQGMHNYLIHCLGFPIALTKNQDGIIATLALEQEDNIWTSSQGIFVQGKRPAIIHQYDRFPRLTKLLKQEYSH